MSTSVKTNPAASGQPRARLTGDLAMWIFILAELTAFTLFILGFSFTQWLKPEMFIEGRAELDSSTGWAMTAGLLTSGFLAALAVERVRKNHARQAGALLLGAIASGMVYVVLKVQEYAHLANAGFDLEYNTFFTLYWITTAFHFLHVLLGLVVLGFLCLRCWQRAYGPHNHSGMESGVLYWHMIDLVWVIIFPLVYLLG
jgi:nitric oxide reductase NorE protein